MKHIMPFFAACALFAGVACSTYTSNTDPNDLGSGNALAEEVTTTTPEVEAPAPATPAPADTVKADAAAHQTEAAH
ncbi:hypothetical protein ACD591_06300 [Rufibacter glacialis]|uniref:Entericidin n=1 Tax=Rufibacter glacialis TaxID=1259555 RepID=A0A5M8QEB8_9BACT|nr:hypothetical protein [Rufibacter glacialis]KAA6433270.1 hypothetical protein FOE74_12350 [Rufibacter glacialis]GGK75982.1 hypothetical protein GCM10011405_24710 [Rufibacter glacialis]